LRKSIEIYEVVRIQTREYPFDECKRYAESRHDYRSGNLFARAFPAKLWKAALKLRSRSNGSTRNGLRSRVITYNREKR